jgi:hypothetical protein
MYCDFPSEPTACDIEERVSCFVFFVPSRVPKALAVGSSQRACATNVN